MLRVRGILAGALLALGLVGGFDVAAAQTPDARNWRQVDPENTQSARTTASIDKLLAEGNSYDLATDKTRRRWAKIASIRKSEIEAKTSEKAESEAAKPVKEKATKKPKKEKSENV